MIGKFYKKEWWAEFCIDILPTGSTVICDPRPTNTDVDYLLLVDKEVVKAFEERLLKEGFLHGGSPGGSSADGLTSGVYVTYTAGILESSGWEVKQFKPSKDFGVLSEFPDFSNPHKEGVFHSWKKRDKIIEGVTPPMSLEPGSVNYAYAYEPELNLILTCSVEYFDNFYKATKLAKRLNLLKKEDRVALFEAVCHDKWD